MTPQEFERFEQTAQWMEEKAREYGLDFFPMRYELCPADVVYSIAGFGMPTRFNHWSFGKHYYRQKIDFDFGMSRIYELVINNDPCYAFFLEDNTILQNEMIVAHVLGHSDFFKNNNRFSRTNRNMVETMSTTAHLFHEYEDRHGIEKVEEVIDAGLSIAEHIDPSLRTSRNPQREPPAKKKNTDSHAPEDLFENEQPQEIVPLEEPIKDVLNYIMENSRHLADWERVILSHLRGEMLYFWPQIETKIMNEGWATYWHNKLMDEMELGEQDAIEFAKLTAGVAQPSPFHLNPYYVGLELWKSIEAQSGTNEMFMVRECDSDSSFLRNYLTQEIVDKCGLYLYERQGDHWVIVERDYKVIRDHLVAERINGGFPVIHVADGDYQKQGGLSLVHAFDGVELDANYINKTLPRVYRLWGRPVSLHTKMHGQEVEYVYDGQRMVTVKG